jgi:hypothetical protein
MNGMASSAMEKKEPMKSLDLVVMFTVDYGQADNGIIQAHLLAHVPDGPLGHQFRLGVMIQGRRQGQVLFFRQVLAVGQRGGRTDMNIGNSQGAAGSGKVDRPQIIHFKGQLGIAVQGGHGRVDDKVRTGSDQIILDILRVADGKLFAAGSTDIYFIRGFGLEVMRKGAADQAGAADQNTESFFPFVRKPGTYCLPALLSCPL